MPYSWTISLSFCLFISNDVLWYPTEPLWRKWTTSKAIIEPQASDDLLAEILRAFPQPYGKCYDICAQPPPFPSHYSHHTECNWRDMICWLGTGGENAARHIVTMSPWPKPMNYIISQNQNLKKQKDINNFTWITGYETKSCRLSATYLPHAHIHTWSTRAKGCDASSIFGTE